MANVTSKLGLVYELLTPKIKAAITAIPEHERCHIQEIRLRLGRFLTATLFGKEYFVTHDGRLRSVPENAVCVDAYDIDTAYKRSLSNSLHSYHREIANGFITTKGGNRVGFCGTAVLDSKDNYSIDTLKHISSVNIRVAREVLGSGDVLYSKAFAEGAASLLIGGPPACGKTTVLRDLCRLIGGRYRVSLVDERNEISASSDGVAQNSVGELTDVFNSYTKSEGITIAVKVMSPEIIVLDEIGVKGDLSALSYAVNSGVKLVATCHAGSFDELKKRPAVSKLLKEKVFDYAALLGTGSMCGQLTSFYKL
ncbi:MAG: AAA family ATPase [Ruminococcus sp.]|nr:AAA family ATPase [Ruminococcus sp.]